MLLLLLLLLIQQNCLYCCEPQLLWPLWGELSHAALDS
jgi:hypothetical protein